MYKIQPKIKVAYFFIFHQVPPIGVQQSSQFSAVLPSFLLKLRNGCRLSHREEAIPERLEAFDLKLYFKDVGLDDLVAAMF